MVSFRGSSSWFGRWWPSLYENLGTLWQSDTASQAYQDKELVSRSAGKSLRLCFRNATPLPLILCWVSEQGTPHHFYKLLPADNATIPTNVVTSGDRTERTSVGHAFVIAANCRDEDVKKTQLDPFTIIGGYRPTTRGRNNNESAVHIITITQQNSVSCCAPWGVSPSLRGNTRRKKYDDDGDEEESEFYITVTEGSFDPIPLDTSKKYYEKATLGGWPVRLEPNWHGGDTKLQERLESDLTYATSRLPPHARDYLKQNTPFYINRSQKYGPKACPISGRGLCFHPGSDWLEENGMSTDKAKCIELYEAADYMDDCRQWGPGGVLLHELCHAYHWKMCRDGYQNKEIMECWKKAMKEGLYDCVLVHTRKGKPNTQKAYACTDQMEYFAELSTAFLGGLDEKEEYNKWFPFCRAQLKEHDPRAYKLLQRVWRVNCDSP